MISTTCELHKSQHAWRASLQAVSARGTVTASREGNPAHPVRVGGTSVLLFFLPQHQREDVGVTESQTMLSFFFSLIIYIKHFEHIFFL